MKKLIPILILLFISNVALSQLGWVVYPTGVNGILRDVYFINANTGWVVGDTTAVFKTTNGGLNWTKQYIYYIIDTKIYSVKFINANTGFAAGGQHSGFYEFFYAYIFKTTNGGINWNTLYSNGGSSWHFNEILPFDESTIFATTEGTTGFESRGGVFKSTNGGLSFDMSVSYGQSNSVSFINPQTGWASAFYWDDVGTKITYILKTTNAGTNWNQQFRDSNDYTSPIPEIQFVNENTGFAIGGYNPPGTRFYKTTNGGTNWSTTDYPHAKSSTLFFLDQYTGWIGGGWWGTDTSVIDYTSNGGLSWIPQKKNFYTRVNSLYFINSLTGWAALHNGNIMKTTTGGFVSVSNIGNEIPTEYKLHQNYTNPFNPTTNIRFDIPRSSHVKLTIYDALGREVVALVNEKLSAGSYEVDWNGSGYPSGIYFYRFEVNNGKDFKQVKRMVLVK
ncbi:MAG: T9SS type A sorting domain-containing protein [Ignavibacteria bacterium]|nr:T9SS type A sorting domain-containing protein [Ignavibacteria bacterium]